MEPNNKDDKMPRKPLTLKLDAETAMEHCKKFLEEAKLLGEEMTFEVYWEPDPLPTDKEFLKSLDFYKYERW